jgi:hypothetical protein
MRPRWPSAGAEAVDGAAEVEAEVAGAGEAEWPGQRGGPEEAAGPDRKDARRGGRPACLGLQASAVAEECHGPKGGAPAAA